MNNSIIIFFVLILAACSENANDKTPAPENDHIWKTQTDALKKAEDLAQQLNEEFKKKAKQMEEAQK